MDNVIVVESRELRMRTHVPPVRVGRMSEESQYNKFPSLPITHPSLSGAFQIFPFESKPTHHIRIDPSRDADAKLICLLSKEGRKTTELTVEETFALNRSSLVDVFHAQTFLS